MYTPKPMEKYKHFKGKCYQVICIADDSENGTKQVVYQALYAPFKFYTRPLEMFVSKVDTEKYPDADQEYRFELLDDEGFIVSRESATEEPKVMQQINPTEEPRVMQQINTAEEPKVMQQINPILERFLDATTIDEKIEIINEEKDHLTPEILTPMELSIGMEPSDEEPIQRYRDIKNFLFLKQKYERQHR